ncbi:MAG: hypothetical protein DRJ05_16445, partial [Bacteroidetes bacterium]
LSNSFKIETVAYFDFAQYGLVMLKISTLSKEKIEAKINTAIYKLTHWDIVVGCASLTSNL